MNTPMKKEELTPRDQKLLEEITRIHASLQTVDQQDAVRMSERVFVNIWLPFFAGDENPTYPVDIQHWVNFSGSPYRAVQVVDTNGALLFTVPALFDRTAVNPVSGDHRSVAHVVRSAEQYSGVHPMQGQRYLDAELTKRALIMKVPASVMANLETWNSIFARYGRPPLIKLDAAAAPGSKQPAADPDISYDVDPL